MKELGVDIFCLQEFGINHEFVIDSLRTVLSEWPYYYVPPSSPAGESLLQLAVFSRYPIKEKQLVTYPNSNNCSLWCDVDINGQTISLFNNILQTKEASRHTRPLAKAIRAADNERT